MGLAYRIPPFSFEYAKGQRRLFTQAPLDIPETGMIWLLGASGAGKSTFLQLLCGRFPEFLQGNISLEPHLVAGFAQALCLAQNPLTQAVQATVAEEFMFSLSCIQHSKLTNTEQLQMLLHEHLSSLNLQHDIWQPIAQLSLGQLQHLLFTSLTVCEPKQLVLDEPSAFLDNKNRAQLYQQLSELKKTTCLLLVEHQLETAQLADLCWYINQNGYIEAISVTEALTRITHDRARASHVQLPSIPEIKTPFCLRAQQLEIAHPKQSSLFQISFELQSGECAVLRGRNGSGKSSFFRTLMGHLPARSGALFIDQFEQALKNQHLITVTKNNASQHMMWIFQHPDRHFLSHSVEQELRQLGLSDPLLLLRSFGLEDLAHESPHLLSEGQKRRLTLLYPCVLQRKVLLFDEPTFGQDAANTERMIRWLNAFKQAGYALIVITHDDELEARLANQIWIIQDNSCVINAHTPKENI